MGGYVINIQSLPSWDIQQTKIYSMDMVQNAYLVVSLFFIYDLIYWFFVFNCLQTKLILYEKINRGKPLIITTKRTVLDVAEGL